MAGSRIDPFFHYPGVIVQAVAPQRDFRLVMAFEAGIAFFDDFPFPRTFRPEHVAKPRVMVARRPHIGGNIIGFSIFFLGRSTAVHKR